MKLIFANFFQIGNNSHSIFYLRSATVHSRVLSPSQVASEHTMNRRLHILDSIQRAPQIHRPTLSEQHAHKPFESPGKLVEALIKLHVDVSDKATALWELIQTRQTQRLRAFLDEIALADTFWKYAATFNKTTSVQEQKNETVSPFGESLLHAAAFAGNFDVVSLLIKHEANVNSKGRHSSCTPLHSAAASGQVAICRVLLDAGAKINSPSLSRKTALYVSASKGWYDVVRLLVESGANPYSGGPTSVETPMALLRKIGSEQGRRLVVEMDALYDARAGGGGEQKPTDLGGSNAAGAESGDESSEDDADSLSTDSFEKLDKDSETDSLSDDAGDAFTGVPVCPSAGHEMVAMVGSYTSFQCNCCHDSRHGKRWFCKDCRDDYCFDCRPEAPKVREPKQEIEDLYKMESEDDDQNDEQTDFEYEEYEEEEEE